jgi:hypothetical protein
MRSSIKGNPVEIQTSGRWNLIGRGMTARVVAQQYFASTLSPCTFTAGRENRRFYFSRVFQELRKC